MLDMPAWGARSEAMAEESRQDRKRLRRKLEPWFEKQCSFTRRAGVPGSRRLSFGGRRTFIPSDVKSVTGLTWVRSDLAYSIATGVSSWEDLLPPGTGDFSQGTGDNQPARTASGGPSNMPYITGDGTNDVMASSINRPAPTTSPTYIAIVARQETWTALDNFFGSSLVQLRLGQRVAVGSINMHNGAPVNTTAAMTVGQWFVVQTLFSGTTSDYIRVGTEPTGGASAGTSTPGPSFSIFDATGAGAPSNISLCEVFMSAGQPNELPDLIGYWSSQFALAA
jgi:hypothetical protein